MYIHICKRYLMPCQVVFVRVSDEAAFPNYGLLYRSHATQSHRAVRTAFGRDTLQRNDHVRNRTHPTESEVTVPTTFL